MLQLYKKRKKGKRKKKIDFLALLVFMLNCHFGIRRILLCIILPFRWNLGKVLYKANRSTNFTKRSNVLSNRWPTNFTRRSNILAHCSKNFKKRLNVLANRSKNFTKRSKVLANRSTNFTKRSNVLANRSTNFTKRSNG